MLVCTKCFRQTKIEIIEKIIKKLNLYRKKKKLRTNKHYLLARWLLLKIVFFSNTPYATHDCGPYRFTYRKYIIHIHIYYEKYLVFKKRKW